MSIREFHSWIEFYRLFPFDDLHRFYRPAAMMAQSNGTKATMRELLDWLQPQPLDMGNMSQEQQERAKSLMNMGFKMARQAKG